MFRSFTLFAPALLALTLACGAQDEPPTPAAAPPAAVEPAGPSTPADLPRAIALSLAQFVTVDGKPVPGPARMEFIYRQGGEWKLAAAEDPDSNVFHKVMVYGERLLSMGLIAHSADASPRPGLPR